MARLVIEEPRIEGGEVTVAARYVSAAGQHRLWYRMDARHEGALATNADPFVIAVQHLAMSVGEPLYVEGSVSPSLLEHLEAFQLAWCAWEGRSFQPVEIDAAELKEPDLPEREEAISGYSGGVDSAFTAYRHARGITTRYPRRLQAVVMVHGFDIPLEEEDGYRRAASRAGHQLDSLGIEMICMATNFRDLPVEWHFTFGTGVASTLALLQGRYRFGLIAQGVPFAAYRSFVEGSNPLTDPMLSSNCFAVAPDGAAFQRTQKLAILADWTEGLDNLRVCWRNPVRDENCCVCEKCIRTILSCRAVGIDLPKSFPKDVSDEQIMGLVPISELKVDVGFGPILHEAESRGLGDERWVRTLRKAIQLSHRKRLFRRARHRLGLKF